MASELEVGKVRVSPADTTAELQLYRDDATINAAGIAIGDINFGGADAGNDNAAKIRVKSDAAWTSTSSPTAFEFQTCPDGSESLATRLTIGSDGLATFSNGINLGNTASATATTLDGYEEGTFTVTTASDATGEFTPETGETGEYTRIGNCVFIRVSIRVQTNFTDNKIAGLPFDCVVDGNTSSWMPLGTALTSSATNAPILVTARNNERNLYFYKQAVGLTGYKHLPSTSEEYYRVTGFYYTTDDFS